MKIDPLQAAQAKRIEAARERWAERHPDAARSEQLIGRHNRRVRKAWDNRMDGTPETHEHAARTVQGSLARLCTRGDISLDQLASAEQIRATHAAITRAVRVGSASIEARVDNSGRRGGLEIERLGTVRAQVAYSGWRRGLARPHPVLAMIVDDIGVSAAARHWRIRNVTAKRLLSDALDAWAAEMGAAVRDVGRVEVLLAELDIVKGPAQFRPSPAVTS